MTEKSKLWYCKYCNFNSCKKKDYNRHLETEKHFNDCVLPFFCCCGKSYKDKSGLWRHKKKCDFLIDLNLIDDDDDKVGDKVGDKVSDKNMKNEEDVFALVQQLIKENSEIKELLIDQNKQMVELVKNAGPKSITNNTTNNTQNNFNLNFFLNETCKNALNIMDFVAQLNLTLEDLEETGRLGFSEGISKIFINGLKLLDVTERPLHCSDLKREIMHIKNDNQWNKEDEEKKLLMGALRKVVHKNITNITKWSDKHPGCQKSTSRENDKYLKMVIQSMPGSDQEEFDKNYGKIMKNISKETTIKGKKEWLLE